VLAFVHPHFRRRYDRGGVAIWTREAWRLGRAEGSEALPQEFQVGELVSNGCGVPRESSGMCEAALGQCRTVRKRIENAVGDGSRRGWVEEDGCPAGNLGDRTGVRGGDGTTRRHRLEDRRSEAFVQTRKDHRLGGAIEPSQLRLGNLSDRAHTHGQCPCVVSPTGKHELELGPLATHASERLEEETVVLVWPKPSRIEQKRFSPLAIWTKDRVVDTMWHDPHEIRIEADAHLRALLYETARDDDEIGRARPTVICERSECPNRSRNEPRVVAVKDVVKRDHARNTDKRQRNCERIVNDRGVSQRGCRARSAGERLKPSYLP
jgi:hypothetical protein